MQTTSSLISERQRYRSHVPLAPLQAQPNEAGQAHSGLRARQALQQGGHHRKAPECQKRGRPQP